MKILFIGSGCAGRLPFAGNLFRKILQEENLKEVQVEIADMAEWGVTPVSETEQSVSTAEKVSGLLAQTDFIVVMEERQRSFFTRFLDYGSWSKIHLFGDYCKHRRDAQEAPTCGNLSYRTQTEELMEGCKRMIHQMKELLKETLSDGQHLLSASGV